jgi:uncharacterized protein (TIGR02145 family)
MKKIFLLFTILFLATTSKVIAQNDSIYFWKSGILIAEKSIKPADLDSITVRKPDYVTICTQKWTAKNLDVTTYSDGTPIPNVTDPTAWANLTTGAWCYYDTSGKYNAIYGKLYNWYAVAGIYDKASASNIALRKKLAPTGWHVPTFLEDWALLIYNCIGGDSVAGGKMKETGTAHWITPNTGATNSSFFVALPGGQRQGNGTFAQLDGYGYWWSSTQYGTTGSTEAFGYRLSYNSSAAVVNYGDKKAGYSVRLVKD